MDAKTEAGANVLDRPLRMLVAGDLVAASDGATLDTINPATGRVSAAVPNASPEDVDRAVAAARAALPAWNALGYAARRAKVLEIARVLREKADAFGLLDTLDTGNVLSAMRLDAIVAAEAIEYFAAIGFEIKGEVTHLDDHLHYTKRMPYGVVLRLLPFNHPIASAGSALAAPLLTGNCLVLKPSPHSPLSALVLAEAIRDIMPPGVISILTGDNERASVPLIRHPGIDRIALVGSVETGKAVMRLAAERLVPVTLELGGKNPLIVFPDVDVEAAADTAIAGMNFRWQSHSCGSTSRILVHRSIEKRFLECLAEKLHKVRVWLPEAPEAQMGAISHRELYDRCLRYLELGRDQGARLLTGGERPKGRELQDGLFLTPALFGGAEPHMDIARDEIFGPIMTVLAWDDYETMLGVANELLYGLAAVVMTHDLDAAHRTAEALDVGYVEVNGPVSFAMGSPFGGVKQSGVGREGSFDELLSYTHSKSINVHLRQRNDLARTFIKA